MTTELIANNFETTLAAPVTTGATTITVVSAAPAALQTAGGQFRVTIDNEYLIVTGGSSTTTWTVTRGTEGSPAAPHNAGALVTHELTAGSLQALSLGAPQVVAAGNLPATATQSVPANTPVWLTGTLTANLTLTVSLGVDSQLRLFVKQDATGGRTLTVNDGSGPVSVAVASAANALTQVDLYSPDGVAIYVSQFGGGVQNPELTSNKDVANGYAGLTSGGLLKTAELPPSVVSASPGPASGGLGWKTLPHEAAYVLSVVGSGVGAVNMKTGNTDYSTASGDHAPVVQSVVNNLLNVAGPTAGLGGKIAFDGNLQFSSQLIVYPNIALVGGGNHGYTVGASKYGSVINSTYVGDCILVQNDNRASTFVYLENFQLYGLGQANGSAQNGIGWAPNGSNANVLDTVIERVGVFGMPQHGWRVHDSSSGSNLKIHANTVYVESVGADAINLTGSPYVWLADVYLQGGFSGAGSCINGSGAAGGFLSVIGGDINSQGVGIYAMKSGSSLIHDLLIGGCTSQGVVVPTQPAQVIIAGNQFSGNGSSSVPQVSVLQASLVSSQVIIRGNSFGDSRGASAVTNHIFLGATGQWLTGSVIDGNSFYGSQGQAIAWPNTVQSHKVQIRNNPGYNSTGQIATPFAGGRVGFMGVAAGPSASNVYTADCVDLMISSTGGTGVSITIKDPAGNTMQSGLATYAGPLPALWSITFGAFTVAPTVYVGAV